MHEAQRIEVSGSGAARPWLVTRLSTSVDWPSRLKSVQSIAARASLRRFIWCGTQRAKLSHTSIPVLLSSRSTCLTACLVTKPRAWARAWPMIATASDAAAITPSVAPARASIRLECRLGQYN